MGQFEGVPGQLPQWQQNQLKRPAVKPGQLHGDLNRECVPACAIASRARQLGELLVARIAEGSHQRYIGKVKHPRVKGGVTQ